MITFIIILFLSLSVFSDNLPNEIVNSIENALNIKTWGFNRICSQELFDLAKYLALERKYIFFVNDLIHKSEEQSIYVVDNFNYIWDGIKKNVTSLPRNWVVYNDLEKNFKVSKNFCGLLFHINKRPGLVLLSTVSKHCLGCSLTIDSKIITTSYDLKSFESYVRDFYPRLNGSTITISIDTLNKCDADYSFDPFFTIQCYHIEIIEMMAGAANFSPLFIVPNYPNNLYDFPNGGLFIQIFNKDVDLSASSFVVTDERIEVMDFVWPTYELKAVMFMKEKSFGVVWMSYFYPLSIEIWVSLFSSAAVASIVFYFIMQKPIMNRSVALSDTLLHAFQIICSQAVPDIAQKLSSKIAYGSLIITAIVIIPSYSGSIISFLTIRPTNARFTSLKQFLDDDQYKINTRKNHFIDQRLRSTLAITHPQALVRLDERAQTEIDGFNQICHDQLSYVIEEEIYRPFIDTYDCDIQRLPFTVMLEYFGMALPKKSILTEYLSRGSLLARSSGFTKRLKELLLHQTHSKKLNKGFEGVTILQIAPLLMLLLFITIISLSILLCERFLLTQRARNNGI